jgi:hypothetical protein
LIAELNAAFLCAHLGVRGELRHAEYINQWLALLKGDNRAIFTAASKASQAANFLRAFSGVAQEVHPKEFREDFKMSDDIALVLKHDGGILRVGNNSWPRSAGTSGSRVDDGHCGLPTDELVPLAEKLLEVPTDLVRTALDLELADGTVIADRVGETGCTFLAGLHRAERAVAERLAKLLNGQAPLGLD